MANYNINVPSKVLTPIAGPEEANISAVLANLKSKYSKIVDEVAANSNVPAELLYSFITFLSNGQNNASWMSGDGLVRSGLFSLSNKVGKGILATEMAPGRMSEAEKKFLREAGDVNLKNFLADEKLTSWGNNEHWKSAYTTGVDRLQDTKIAPINWQNEKIAIQTGAIWIGQVWDEIAKQTSKPLDNVIVTIFLPYGLTAQAGTQRTQFDRPWLMGSSFAKSKPWDVNYADSKETKGKYWLPGPGSAAAAGDTSLGFSQKGTAHIINPKGGDIRNVIRYIMAKNGSLDKLTA